MKGPTFMYVKDLIEILQDCDPYTEVRLAHQPSWPFEYSVETAQVVGGEDESCPRCGVYVQVRDHDAGCEYASEPKPESTEPVLYLAEGEQLGYLPGNVAESLGWR